MGVNYLFLLETEISVHEERVGILYAAKVKFLCTYVFQKC